MKATDITLPEEYAVPPRDEWEVEFELTPEEFQKAFDYTMAKCQELKGKHGRESYAYWAFELDGWLETAKNCLSEERFRAYDEAIEEAGCGPGESLNDACWRAEFHVFGEVESI